MSPELLGVSRCAQCSVQVFRLNPIVSLSSAQYIDTDSLRGRIMNRLSKDVSSIDVEAAESQSSC